MSPTIGSKVSGAKYKINVSSGGAEFALLTPPNSAKSVIANAKVIVNSFLFFNVESHQLLVKLGF